MAVGFSSPVDIANRALQKVGATRITAFTDDSKQAAETGFCYDKLRRAELRRNQWRFSIKKCPLRPLSLTTMTMVFAPWSPTAEYPAGSVVSYQGINWITMVAIPAGIAPGTPLMGWDTYFGPMIADVWNKPTQGIAGGGTIPQQTVPTAYMSGDVVYETASQDGVTVVPPAGVAAVFISLQNANTEEPLIADAWNSTTQYTKGQPVSFGGWYYSSLIDFNINREPDLEAPQWDINTTYAANAKVHGSDGLVYQSIAGSNLGNNPVLDTHNLLWQALLYPAAWTPQFAQSTGSLNWLRLYGAQLVDLNFVYPIGAGPSEQATTRNVFMLPNGYIRFAPQDPKAGSTSYLGAPSGLWYTDWTYEGNYFTSRETNTIVYRFTADVQDVTKMDDMFCEGLACRIGLEVAEPLTQSGAKIGTISQEYKTFMSEARIVNGIETGPTEPPEDDWITTRI